MAVVYAILIIRGARTFAQVPPTGSHDTYNTGDKVIYEGQVYESIIDGNTWSPVDYPQEWKEV